MKGPHQLATGISRNYARVKSRIGEGRVVWKIGLGVVHCGHMSYSHSGPSYAGIWVTTID
jgi:hypothetical protein